MKSWNITIWFIDTGLKKVKVKIWSIENKLCMLHENNENTITYKLYQWPKTCTISKSKYYLMY